MPTSMPHIIFVILLSSHMQCCLQLRTLLTVVPFLFLPRLESMSTMFSMIIFAILMLFCIV